MIDVTKTDFKFFSDRLMTDVDLWSTLINLGKKFIPADYSPLGIFFTIFFKYDLNFKVQKHHLGMISRYLILSRIHVTKTTLCCEIETLIGFLGEYVEFGLPSVSGNGWNSRFLKCFI